MSPSATTRSSPTVTVAPGQGVTDSEIQLGMTNDLSGAGGTPYAQVTQAMQTYFRKLSTEDGGVCGRKLTLIAQDDQYSPDHALEKTKELVETDHVLAMVGGLGTQVHAPVAAYLSDPNGDGNTADGIPDLFLSTGWSGWGDVNKFPWTVGYIPDYVADSRILAGYINRELPGKKVGVIYEDSDFGRDYLTGLQTTLTDPSLLVASQAYLPAEVDAGREVTAVRDAGAEVTVLAASPEFSALAYKSANDNSYHPQFFLSYVNTPSRLARLIGGGTSPDQLAAGFRQLTGSISTAYLLSPVSQAEDQAIVEHTRIMTNYNGPEVSTLTVYGQSLAELIAETLRHSCGNLTRQGVLKGAESIRGFHSSLLLPGIQVNLSASDHYAIQALQLQQIQADGTFKDLGKPVSTE